MRTRRSIPSRWMTAGAALAAGAALGLSATALAAPCVAPRLPT